MTAQRVRHAWSKHAFVWGHLPLFSALTVLVTKIGLCVSDRVTCNGLNNWSDYSVNTRLAVLSGVWVVRQTAFIHFKYPSWAINKWKQRCYVDSECNVNIYLKKYRMLYYMYLYYIGNTALSVYYLHVITTALPFTGWGMWKSSVERCATSCCILWLIILIFLLLFIFKLYL